MREYKFRAWDKEEERMLIHNDLTYTDVFWTACDLDKFVVLMQFTGLKDKNGKEIYEGDIAKYQNEIWYVTHFQGSFCLERKGTKNTFTKPTGEILINDEPYEEKMYWGSVEVIGNIYENPELTKKKE